MFQVLLMLVKFIQYVSIRRLKMKRHFHTKNGIEYRELTKKELQQFKDMGDELCLKE